MHIYILPQCSTTAARVLNSAGMDAQFERLSAQSRAEYSPSPAVKLHFLSGVRSYYWRPAEIAPRGCGRTLTLFYRDAGAEPPCRWCSRSGILLYIILQSGPPAPTGSQQPVSPDSVKNVTTSCQEGAVTFCGHSVHRVVSSWCNPKELTLPEDTG